MSHSGLEANQSRQAIKNSALDSIKIERYFFYMVLNRYIHAFRPYLGLVVRVKTTV